ncbi:hypothetical protein EVAR_9945_1 [Eumeta japonica]|uniref:Uncharacterized protein n=1 Tax=Eumeta variegata TaxID=151549 RepID=A0A4C1TQU3_EUMVA|nr:hypothetical protein EVAR_9945_1 [Eumeta japonica]
MEIPKNGASEMQPQADDDTWSRNMVIRDTGGSREDVLLKDDMGRVCNPDKSAVLFADTFFPDEQVDTDDPYDGFTSEVCHAAILRNPGLFLAVANKCLRLGYFPRAWKEAAIKV